MRKLCSSAVALFVVAACGTATGPSGQVAAMKALPLPITGEWAMVEWKGSVTSTWGASWKTEPAHRVFSAREKQGLGVFNIDGTGRGTITGKRRCALSVETPTGTPASLSGSQVVNGINGALGVITAVYKLVTMVTGCTAGSYSEDVVQVTPSHTFWGAPLREIESANAGVYGEGGGAQGVQRECEGMRGIRFVRLGSGEASACIGYNNGAATEVKMMLVKTGDIYVQRVIFRRPGGG